MNRRINPFVMLVISIYIVIFLDPFIVHAQVTESWTAHYNRPGDDNPKDIVVSDSCVVLRFEIKGFSTILERVTSEEFEESKIIKASPTVFTEEVSKEKIGIKGILILFILFSLVIVIGFVLRKQKTKK